MTASRDPDRLIHAFLREGLDELPDPVYDAVRDRIEETRQRAFIGPWRTSGMNRYLKIGLAAAAVVVIAVVGFQFLGNRNNGGPGATETPQPTVTQTAIPEPSSPPEGLLPEGSHFLWGRNGAGVRITVTIPAPDWYGEPGGGALQKDDNSQAPDGAGLFVYAGPTELFPRDLYVYGDPCHWQTTRPDAFVGTVEEAVTALAGQTSRNASTPTDITVAGHAGKSITLHVPDDAVFSDCDQGEFRTLVQVYEDGSGEQPRSAQDPGQIEKLWVLDVDGHLVIVGIGYYPGTPQSVVDELDTIVESASMEVPPR